MVTSIKKTLIVLLSVLFAMCSVGSLAKDTINNYTPFDTPLCKDLPIEDSQHILGLSLPITTKNLEPRLVEIAGLYPEITACVFDINDTTPLLSPVAKIGTGIGVGVYVFWAIIAVLLYFYWVPVKFRRAFTFMQALTGACFIWVTSALTLFLFTISGVNNQLIPSYAIYQIEDKSAFYFKATNVRMLDQALLARGLKPLQPVKDGLLLKPKKESQQLPEYTIVKHALNLRRNAGIQHERLAILPRGTKVKVLKQFEHAIDWWQIKTPNGQIGWVSSLYLKRQ